MEDYTDLDYSMNADFEIVEQEGKILVGFSSPGDRTMFNDLYEPERWLNYLLDPGKNGRRTSENYEDVTQSLQMFGLTLVDEMIDREETRETVMDYEEELNDMTHFGFSEEVRSYASELRKRIKETD